MTQQQVHTWPADRPAVSPARMAVAPAARAQAQLLAQAVPELRTARLVLRAPALSDFTHYAAIVCGPRGQFVDGPMTAEAAWDDFARMTATWLLRGHGLWTVTADGAVIGFVLIGCEPGDEAHELGFLFLPEGEGLGYAHAAARAARDYARDVLNLPALVSYCDPANARACALALRLGAADRGRVSGAIRFQYWGHVA